MAIKFKTLSWVNFLSTGSGGNQIQLDKFNTNLITGKNGAGKSTMLDALFFALFNRPFRSINKGQLVNSINGKNCVVTLTFDTSGKSYKVVRGIKPNVFEIWEDEELITKEAASKDYQKILEQQILKFNYKTFGQTEVLGSASYVPFMKLSAAARRETIEDILDIGVFSSMNDILKQEFAEVKTRLVDIDYKLNASKDKIQMQNKLISALSESKDEQIAESNNKIQELVEKNFELDISIQELIKATEQLHADTAGYDAYLKRKDQAKSLITKSKTIQDQASADIKFFESHDVCPTCSQPIGEDHKHGIVTELLQGSNQQLDKIHTLESALVQIMAKIEEFESLHSEIRLNNSQVNTLNNEVSYNLKQITQLQKLIIDKSGATDDIEKERNILKQLAAEGVDLVEKKNEALEEKALKEQAILLLKDTGIKTSIIKEYLPIINKQINKYLGEMDFFCNFELDETFTEKIKSRGRDEFTYANFSEGEKQRLDLAIMLTFRYISKMKNSLNTNLLILDEIFSSSLDQTAVDFLIDMLTNLQNTNVFVITHHGEKFIEVFDNHIQYEKRNDFSVMKEPND